jgi:homoserine O-acetyltransferase
VRLLAGYSMGALQGYEWAVRHPARVERLLVIAGATRTGRSARALIDGLAGTLTEPDPLRRHAARWRELGVSGSVYERRRWRSLGHGSEAEFTRAVFDDDLAGWDPRDLLCQLAKWRAADVSRHAGGDLAAALGRIRARTCVIALEGDPFAPLEQCAAEQTLIPGAELRLVETCWGHYAFAGFDARDTAAIDQAIRDLLAHD